MIAALLARRHRAVHVVGAEGELRERDAFEALALGGEDGVAARDEIARRDREAPDLRHLAVRQRRRELRRPFGAARLRPVEVGQLRRRLLEVGRHGQVSPRPVEVGPDGLHRHRSADERTGVEAEAGAVGVPESRLDRVAAPEPRLLAEVLRAVELRVDAGELGPSLDVQPAPVDLERQAAVAEVSSEDGVANAHAAHVGGGRHLQVVERKIGDQRKAEDHPRRHPTLDLARREVEPSPGLERRMVEHLQGLADPAADHHVDVGAFVLPPQARQLDGRLVDREALEIAPGDRQVQAIDAELGRPRHLLDRGHRRQVVDAHAREAECSGQRLDVQPGEVPVLGPALHRGARLLQRAARQMAEDPVARAVADARRPVPRECVHRQVPKHRLARQAGGAVVATENAAEGGPRAAEVDVRVLHLEAGEVAADAAAQENSVDLQIVAVGRRDDDGAGAAGKVEADALDRPVDSHVQRYLAADRQSERLEGGEERRLRREQRRFEIGEPDLDTEAARITLVAEVDATARGPSRQPDLEIGTAGDAFGVAPQVDVGLRRAPGCLEASVHDGESGIEDAHARQIAHRPLAARRGEEIGEQPRQNLAFGAGLAPLEAEDEPAVLGALHPHAGADHLETGRRHHAEEQRAGTEPDRHLRDHRQHVAAGADGADVEQADIEGLRPAAPGQHRVAEPHGEALVLGAEGALKVGCEKGQRYRSGRQPPRGRSDEDRHSGDEAGREFKDELDGAPEQKGTLPTLTGPGCSRSFRLRAPQNARILLPRQCTGPSAAGRSRTRRDRPRPLAGGRRPDGRSGARRLRRGACRRFGGPRPPRRGLRQQSVPQPVPRSRDRLRPAPSRRGAGQGARGAACRAARPRRRRGQDRFPHAGAARRAPPHGPPRRSRRHRRTMGRRAHDPGAERLRRRGAAGGDDASPEDGGRGRGAVPFPSRRPAARIGTHGHRPRQARLPRAQLLERHRPHRPLRRGANHVHRQELAARLLHPSHPRPRPRDGGAHRRRLRVPHRPAPAPRSRRHAARPLGDGGRDLLREHGPELGTGGDDPRPAGRRRPRAR